MDKKINKKILLVGPLPPPNGGVSIHIKRFARLIENDFDVDYVDESCIIKRKYFNLRSYRLPQYLKRVQRTDLMFIHSGTRLLIVFHLMAAKLFRKKIILTVHGYPIKKKNFFTYIDSLFYSLADHIIVVNSYILDRVSLPFNKAIIKNAFLPPFMEDEHDLSLHLTEWLIRRKSLGKIIICANAFQLRIFNSQDLYGLDMCIEVADNLIKKGLPVSFVFNVSSLDKNRDLYEKYQNIIKERDLNKDFLLINEELSFVKLITYSDIVLRPTNTDGDALTIREALYFNKSVIASDIVPRPTGTILFKSRDIIDLEVKIRETLSLGLKSAITGTDEQNNEYQIFYKGLIDSVLTDSH